MAETSAVASAAGLDKLFPTKSGRQTFASPGIPKVIFVGLPQSGKTSIARVVYGKTSPHETLYCMATRAAEIHKIASSNRLLNLGLVDLPGGLLLTDSQFDTLLFANAATVVFVIDAQGDQYTAVAHCKSIFKRAWEINKQINLEVFIHKIDGDIFTVDDNRTDCQRDIHDKLMRHLEEDEVDARVVFYSTSIYDHTVFEACSRVVQKLVPQTATLEELLDHLVAKCKMEKTFLIDILSKTFIATDTTSSFDPLKYEICTDLVDVVVEISYIYGQPMSSTTDLTAASPGNTSGETEETAEDMCSTFGLIQLSDEDVLYLREVDRHVALACIMKSDNFDKPQLVDYNIRIFRDCMLALFAQNDENRRLPSNAIGLKHRSKDPREVVAEAAGARGDV